MVLVVVSDVLFLCQALSAIFYLIAIGCYASLLRCEKCDALLVVESPVLVKTVALGSLKAPAFVIIEVSAIIMSN